MDSPKVALGSCLRLFETNGWPVLHSSPSPEPIWTTLGDQQKFILKEKMRAY